MPPSRVGVFHDPDLDADEAPVVPAGDAPAPGDAPAFTSEREAEYGGRSVAAMAMREDGSGPNTPLASGTDEVSKTGLGSTSGSAPGTGAVPGTGAAAPMSVSIDSPRAVVGPGGESTLSTSSRDLFEPSRPRYPRKDLLEHLVPIFNSHFRTSFFPWIEEGEVGKGVREGTLPAILANGICAMTAR